MDWEWDESTSTDPVIASLYCQHEIILLILSHHLHSQSLLRFINLTTEIDYFRNQKIIRW